MSPDAGDTGTSEGLESALVEFIRNARWFGGKGRAFTVTQVNMVDMVNVVSLQDHEPQVSIALVTLSFEDGGTDVYQVPMASYADQKGHLGHALIARHEGRHVYDALHDRAATRVWLEAFHRSAGDDATGDSSTPAGSGLTFRRVGKHDLDLSAESTLFSGEQSNSSVAFGQDALMKVFRRLTPGVNPDIEIHEALTLAGTDSIAELYGWIELAPEVSDGPPVQLAMLQQFLRAATDGWELALASARTLITADPSSDEVGDFTADSRRLGVAVSEVHEILREQFGTQAFDAAATSATMRQRLSAAIGVVPQLADHSTALETVFDHLADAPGDVHRVHGDLHLGQTLRTALGWKLVDFEGEPAKTLEERQLPDSPWRDVAGMLRSFDYAAQSVVKELDAADESPEPAGNGAQDQIASRADEWRQLNRAAFLEGYVERRVGRGEPTLTAAEETVINAYEADKAVYEVIYEARNRPSWLDIPLQAIDRIGAES
jgi:maltokinase